ncbi:hypothetical protein I5P58_15035 [Serratia ureilytica]|nr:MULTISPECIES: sugar-binding domain-containing protein [Serratia]AWC78585.1 hypothetical protein AM377_02375 [Serratia marcescens]MBH2616989.1 hypothetical protein [Serratia ureilytica]
MSCSHDKILRKNAIHGTLEGDYIDVLITDYTTARSLLKTDLG